ncbi:MAG: mechanosensitive ion channel family protein [Candidatus Omnitrophota bacterium]
MIEILTQQMFFGNHVLDYLLWAGFFLVGAIVIKIIEHVVIKRMKKWAHKTTTTIDDFLVEVIHKQVLPFAYFALFYAATNILKLTSFVEKGLNIAGTAVLTIFAARLLTVFIAYGFSRYCAKRSGDIMLERSLHGILKIVKLLVWAMAAFFFLDNLGFKISAVVAGLGIGGVAVALAAQAVLGDLFSYFAILFDRPFEIGDFIIVGDFLGSVEHIGIKTTRICSLSGEQVVFSNTDLTNSRIRNYKRMAKRRVNFKLGVTYDTPLEKLKKISTQIEQIIKKVDDTIFDRAHFFSFDDFCLTFEIVYYVIGSDYNKYMDIQQKINFAIKDLFEKEKIEFAFPTQTLYVNKTN